MYKHLLARNLRFLRKARGLSQQELADALSLKRNHISAFETGVAEPKAVTLIALARFFGHAAQDLMYQDITSSQQPPAASSQVDLEQLLEVLVVKTADMEKVVAQFRTFYRNRLIPGQETSESLQAFGVEFEHMLVVLDQLLKTNHLLIEAIRRER